jgi:glycosyltransferase involved in cell wall biosynthesis
MISQSKVYKIAIIGDSLSVGGAERVHARLSDFFVANNNEVFNCIFVDSVTYNYSGELFNLGKIHQDSNSIVRKFNRFIKLKQFVDENQFDVIIDFRMRKNFFQEYLISNFIYKKRGVFSVRSGFLPYYFPKSSFLSKLIHKNKKVVAVSSAVKDKIILKKLAKNVTYIYNPIDFNDISELKEAFVPNAKKYILAIGRMNNDIKQFDKLINAYSKSSLPQKAIDLILLGEGKNQADYVKLTQQLEIEDKVKFLGFQENPFPYYKNAVFTVLSSKNEGFPNVLIESLACETPVVSFDCFSGPNEIIQNGENGLLVENQNFEKLTEAMNVLVDDEKLYQNCKNNAKASIGHLKMETIGQLWLDLLKKDVS